LCKAVRYRITAKPIITRVCWCRLCQYLGAGSGTVNVGFPTEAIHITGELKDYSCIADSGNVMHRRFCPACGTPLFSEAESRPQFMFVRAGRHFGRSRSRPTGHDDLDVPGAELGLHQ
jgi:hypothetical protein